MIKIFSDLLGQTLSKITATDDSLVMVLVDGNEYTLYHDPDCCETVTIESIVGELDDLVGSQLVQAEEVSSNEDPPDVKPEILEYRDSFTWTFYKLATIKGSVTIRWYGESNGYYSESVDFKQTKMIGDNPNVN